MDFIAFILVLFVAGAATSLALAAFIRSHLLCIIAATLISEILLDLYSVTAGLDPRYPEMSLLAVNLITFFGTPVLAASATATVLLTRRLRRHHPADPKP